MDAGRNVINNLSRSLTNTFDAVHNNVQFLSWSELSYKDVTVDGSNTAVCKHICLIPNGNPVDVPGIHYWTQHRGQTPSHNTVNSLVVKGGIKGGLNHDQSWTCYFRIYR